MSHEGEKQVDFKIHFRQFKAFLDHVFFKVTPNLGLGLPSRWVAPPTLLETRTKESIIRLGLL